MLQKLRKVMYAAERPMTRNNCVESGTGTVIDWARRGSFQWSIFIIISCHLCTGYLQLRT